MFAAASDAPSTLAILLEHLSASALSARVRLTATAPRVHPLAPRHVLALVHHRLVHAHQLPGLASLVDAAKEVAAAGGPGAPASAPSATLAELIALGPRFAREAPLAPKALETLTGVVVDNFVCVFVCVCVCCFLSAGSPFLYPATTPPHSHPARSDSHKLRSGRDVTGRIGALQALLGVGEGGSGVYTAPGGAEAAAALMEAAS